jgi:hypothetical protein
MGTYGTSTCTLNHAASVFFNTTVVFLSYLLIVCLILVEHPLDVGSKLR